MSSPNDNIAQEHHLAQGLYRNWTGVEEASKIFKFFILSSATRKFSIKLSEALCSTLVIRPRLNSAKEYFFPKSSLSYVFVYDLMIYDNFLSTL